MFSPQVANDKEQLCCLVAACLMKVKLKYPHQNFCDPPAKPLLWFAKPGDINQLCRFMGHDDPETTFKHYAKAATKRDAEKFWAIFPRVAAIANIVAFHASKSIRD
jgi:hypothetical protein